MFIDVHLFIVIVRYIGEEVLAYESADYQRVRWTSLKYREVFWSSLAKKLLVWRCEDFVAIDCCSPKTGHIEWFKEGKLNASGKLQIFGSQIFVCFDMQDSYC